MNFSARRRLAAACLLLVKVLFAQDPTVDAGSQPAAAAAVGGISFPEQARLGNIFVRGEDVRIEARIASGDRADWMATDFRGGRVDSGTSPVKDHRAAITPHASGNGYYLVRIKAQSGQRTTGEGETSFAVVPHIDLSGMADSRFGVMTHFAKSMSTDILPLLRQAGIAHVRDENAWGQVEKSPGVFDFTGRDGHLIKYMADLGAAGVTPLEVMAFGNKLHFDSPNVPVYQAAPYDQQGYETYANYCAAVLKQYGSQIKALEIWNEYNGSFCAGPAAADGGFVFVAWSTSGSADLTLKSNVPVRVIDLVGGEKRVAPAKGQVAVTADRPCSLEKSSTESASTRSWRGASATVIAEPGIVAR